ncbi:hypothetical protein [Enterobacter sp.]|uniref:hypothetical protein n=1 Tax=Enterobacter sp. TaxID=42895 RepID=UPI00296F14E9|nr:hypothetical protein [Enterobacter sp.]
MKAHPEVPIVFKGWPIFAEKFPASVRAALRGLNIWKQLGAIAYMAYLNNIYRTVNNERKLSDADVEGSSKAADLRDIASSAQSHLLAEAE